MYFFLKICPQESECDLYIPMGHRGVAHPMVLRIKLRSSSLSFRCMGKYPICKPFVSWANFGLRRQLIYLSFFLSLDML